MNDGNNKFKSGFVAVVGMPNVGKSTLINTFLGRKVSIVSPKPQTTRNSISGILTTESYQIVFEDTPGITQKRDKLSAYMQSCLNAAVEGGDIIMLVIDAFKGVSDAEKQILQKYDNSPNFLCVVNKIDAAKLETVMPVLSCISKMYSGEVYTISALTGKGTDILLQKIIELLPYGERYFPHDMICDRNHRFMTAEIIREKMLFRYSQEVPHGVGVAVTEYSYDDEKQITNISAEIYCQKPSHKKIIIGKGGAALKETGASARMEIEELIGGKVFLSLWVKVKPDWNNSEYFLKQLGYC